MRGQLLEDGEHAIGASKCPAGLTIRHPYVTLITHGKSNRILVIGMDALVWHGDDKLAVERLSEPSPAAGQVVFDVSLAGICGSDLHGYRGHPGPRRPPLVLGHEAVGTVPGRDGRFTLFPLVACGECRSCLQGRPNLCERRGLLGLDRPGVFAHRVAVGENQLVPIPDDVEDRVAVLVEPLATSVAALRASIHPDADPVLVLGAGPIGLLAVFLLVSRGRRVVVVEPLPRRREQARVLGASEVHADASELGTSAFDLALDAVAVESSWTAAIDAVRSGGEVVVIGLGQDVGMLPVGQLVRRGITVRGQYAYTRDDFETALALLGANAPHLGWLTVLGLDAGPEAFRRLVKEPDATIKVLLSVDGRAPGASS
jgi:threonine dehydrogenase-like Zn-dependent dehydrogenase